MSPSQLNATIYNILCVILSCNQLFALDRVNKDRSLLGDVRLGADIRDTCALETHALEEALQYVKASMSGLGTGDYACSDGSEAQLTVTPRPVAAVIGASLSSVSTQVDGE